MNLYLFAVSEHADDQTLAKIDEKLKPPLWWRHPVTGLPDGFSPEDRIGDDWL